MTSRARLLLTATGGRTRIAAAYAETPQRWTPGPAGGGWLTVFQQLLGDGCFPADRLATSIRLEPGAVATVRAVAATSLRAGAPSVAVTRLSVGPRATLIYLPGALIPHAAATHHAALDARIDPSGALAVFQTWTPGRTSHEAARFTAIRARTRLAVGDTPVLCEDVTVTHEDWPPGSPVVLTALALGRWRPSAADWWEPLPSQPSWAAAAELPFNAAIYRALFPNLGDANRFIENIVSRICNLEEMNFSSSSRKLLATASQAG